MALGMPINCQYRKVKTIMHPLPGKVLHKYIYRGGSNLALGSAQANS